jgi:hypothetical protein
MALVLNTIPAVANDYLKIHFKDGHTERHYLKLVESISTSKYDMEGNLHDDYQTQRLVISGETYTYPLADIDSISYHKVDIEQVKKDVNKVTTNVENILSSSLTVEDIQSHLDEIKEIEGVENVISLESGIAVQIKDWITISYTRLPELAEEENDSRAATRGIENILTNSSTATSSGDRPYRVVFANKLHNDVTRMDQQYEMLSLNNFFNKMGFVSNYINNLDLNFFINDLYYYDFVILLTHGFYYYDVDKHYIKTDERVDKDALYQFIYDHSDILNESDIDDIWYDASELGPIKLNYYLTISEDFIKKHCSYKNHKKPSIFFNGACHSLNGNDVLDRNVEPFKVWGNSNMAKVFNEKGYDIYIGYNSGNHHGISGGVNLFENMLNGMSEDVAFSHIEPKYLTDNYLFKKAYLTEVYDNDAGVNSRSMFIVKTKTKDPSALDYLNNIVNGEVKLFGTTTMLRPDESPVRCGFSYSINGGTVQQKYCDEFNGSDLKEDNVSFSANIKLNPGQTVEFKAFTYDGKNYNYGETCSFTVPKKAESEIIQFKDALVKEICVQNWDTDGDGELSYDEAASVTDLGRVFESKKISSFNELQYFTGLRKIGTDGVIGRDVCTPVFWGCSDLVSVKIPSSVTLIGSYVFWGCNSLQSIEIPNQVQKICIEAFYGCANLTSIKIPNSVKSIGESAFASCSGLSSIILGNGVTNIDFGVFSYCNNLKDVFCLNTDVAYTNDSFYNNYPNMITLHVPAGSVDKYAAAEPWKDFKEIVPIE